MKIDGSVVGQRARCALSVLIGSDLSSPTDPGVNGPFQRHVCVYLPAHYVPGTPAPVIVSADAYGMRYGLPTILDNMIADHRLPVMAAVMIANGGAERSLEYDTVSMKYADYVEAEVLPRAEKEANIKLTKDPEGRLTFGGSSGGAVALTMAWFKPELYHRVLTYSGTYVDLRNGPDAPHGAWEYLEHFIPDNPAKPLRFLDTRPAEQFAALHIRGSIQISLMGHFASGPRS
jgi:enterochelin esterase-like enzyme